jgi:excisionase family DNA binding protein
MKQRESFSDFLSDFTATFDNSSFDLSPNDISIALGHIERIRSTLWSRVFHPLPIPTLSSADNQQLLSVGEAAAFLGISKSEVRRLYNEGLLEGVRIKRRLLFKREALIKFINDRNGPKGGS